MCRIATGRGSFAAARAQALKAPYSSQFSFTFVPGDIQEKPGNGIRVGRGNAGGDLTEDAATLIQFPGWSGEVTADDLTFGSHQTSVGRFQCPGITCGTSLASINLCTDPMGLKQQVLAGGCLQRDGQADRNGVLSCREQRSTGES